MAGLRWDDDEAWRITERAEAWLRENQPADYAPTPEESKAFDVLIARRRVAGERHDMREWGLVHLEMLREAREWFDRHAAERVPTPRAGDATRDDAPAPGRDSPGRRGYRRD